MLTFNFAVLGSLIFWVVMTVVYIAGYVICMRMAFSGTYTVLMGDLKRDEDGDFLLKTDNGGNTYVTRAALISDCVLNLLWPLILLWYLMRYILGKSFVQLVRVFQTA